MTFLEVVKANLYFSFKSEWDLEVIKTQRDAWNEDVGNKLEEYL